MAVLDDFEEFFVDSAMVAVARGSGGERHPLDSRLAIIAIALECREGTLIGGDPRLLARQGKKKGEKQEGKKKNIYIHTC